MALFFNIVPGVSINSSPKEIPVGFITKSVCNLLRINPLVSFKAAECMFAIIVSELYRISVALKFKSVRFKCAKSIPAGALAADTSSNLILLLLIISLPAMILKEGVSSRMMVSFAFSTGAADWI